MKFNYVHRILLLIAGSVSIANAGCECWWEGTAPFCDSTCPSNSRATGIFSNSGDGGYCITGRKQRCVRCGPHIAEKPCCIPTHTCAQCTFGLMICHEVVTDIPPVECGTHICGLCTGIGSTPNLCAPGVKYEEWTPPRPGDAIPTPWNPFNMLRTNEHDEL
ncbi:uncharacterized protein EI97DRAFT_102871 [Westerdykella ornata]|uniref:Uncharacterized protein n=1 Tax=Westerdykella ornata TaxID=318751 RepID=A0A6A6JF17_WESOR|nr:uncharacterized protein EI97DRAFT_102871 [Westerdykella ornata]KAF2274578.1 hypothetical protein EI97DRAFT_102871 [Westerdykella ornata]